MPEQDMGIRVSLEEAEEALSKINAMREAVRQVDPVADKTAQSFGKLKGGIAGMAASLISATAVIASARQALGAYGQQVDASLASVDRLATKMAVLNAQYGTSEAGRMAMQQGARYGVAGGEAIEARMALTRALGRGGRTEEAVTEAYRLGGAGLSAAEMARPLAGLMQGGLSAKQASNLIWTSQLRTGGAGLDLAPRVLGAASSYGFGGAEALALQELVTQQGGTGETAMQLMRGLGGGSAEAAKILKRYGISGGLGSRMSGALAASGRMSAAERAVLFGETGLQVAGNLDMSRFAEASGAWGRALSTGDTLARYRPVSIEEQRAIDARKTRAANEITELDYVRMQAESPTGSMFSAADRAAGDFFFFGEENKAESRRQSTRAYSSDEQSAAFWAGEKARAGAREGAREQDRVHSGQ